VFLGKDMETHNAYSDDTAKTIDSEMRGIVDKQHERATEMLTAHRSVLDNMARVLIERETIYFDEVEMLMQGKSYSEVIEYMDSQEDVASKAYKKLS
jgi:cell division protease FtsH